MIAILSNMQNLHIAASTCE